MSVSYCCCMCFAFDFGGGRDRIDSSRDGVMDKGVAGSIMQ